MPKATYKSSGVNIDKANSFIKRITPLIKSTFTENVVGSFGGFSGGFAPFKGRACRNPVLVASTDGVGTKLKLAIKFKEFETAGIDLVAMCVNDIVCSGARPMFFLDYFAMGRLDSKMAERVIKGIARACREAGCSLIGGETAEMPGMYRHGEFDLAGFCVGIVEKNKIIDGSAVKEGDVLVGAASNGIHSNGFSLVRKVLSIRQIEKFYKKEIMRPTRLYVNLVMDLVKSIQINAIAHITGGGFIDNIPRVLPKGFGVRIEKGSWPVKPIFEVLRKKGNISQNEMFKVFNMGIGMVFVARKKYVDKIKEVGKRHGIECWRIGSVVKGGKKEVRFV